MADRRKFWILSVSAVAVLAIILLAAGLSGLELLPGQRLPRAPQAGDFGFTSSLPEGDTLPIVIWRVLSIILVALFPISILRFVISPQMRKRVVRDFFLYVGALMLYYLIVRLLGERGLAETVQPLGADGPLDPALNGAAADARVEPPEWLSFAASLLLVVLLLGAARFMWRRYRNASSPFEQLAREAQLAVADLQSGADLKNVVVRCYADMCRTLSAQRGIRRQAAMTPREFETRLTALSLPREQVLRLTRLFESVRYGSKTPGEHEEQEAVTCLSAIAEACARLA